MIVERAPDDQVRASRQPHRKALPEDDRLSYLAESVLGRLSLMHKDKAPKRGEQPERLITREQCDAGFRFAEIVGAYRSVIGAPRSTAGSGRGLECEQLCRAAHELLSAEQRAQVHDGLQEACRCLARKTRYDSAFEALAAAGQRAAKMVARVAVHGDELPPEGLVYLVAGLSALARHFGLTARRGERSLGNTH